ncbi:hypothetical protein [Actinoplanes subtropicus]|uniref:hypothetical protein n=1 Tax=Actinoplanes subtropicus TaxID=543632 RepID=UPI0004C2EF5C|nr:hypothetical protein [Actinoplanes subtropicus]
MNSFETRLAERLHDMADGDFDSAAPIVGVLARGWAAGPRRTAVRLAGASLAVLAAGGVVTTVAVHPWSAERSGGVAAVPQPPEMALMAAVAASDGVSYELTLTTVVKSTPGSPDQVTTGAFDPVTRTGFTHTPYDDGPGFSEQRLVKGVRYLGDAGIDRKIVWRKVAGTFDSLDFAGEAAGRLGASADPAQLRAILRDRGAKVTMTGDRTYHFTFAVAKKDLLPQSLSDRFAGDVTVGADNRIATVTYERTLQWAGKSPGRKPGPPVVMAVTMAFSDYGAPVTVEAPAAK